MSQQKAWDCPECGQKGIHKKGVTISGMNGQKICMPCARRILTARRKELALADISVNLPVKCPICNEKGLVLLYNFGSHEMEAICYAREDPHGRFIQGCSKSVFHFLMSEKEFKSLCQQPVIRDNFFTLQVVP